MQKSPSISKLRGRVVQAMCAVAGLAALAMITERFAPASSLREPARTGGPSAPGNAADPFPRTVIDGSGLRVRIARTPMKLVSTDWAIDEFLYAVVPPERVAGVSDNAALERVSNVYGWVKQFQPIVANDAERVIRAQPDLVITSSESRADFTNLVNAAGVATYRMASGFTSLQQIEEAITLVGYLTGEDGRAARERRHFREAIEAARDMRSAGMAAPRILGISGGFTYGAGTVFDDIVRAIGGINVGAEGGLKGYDSASGEQIVRWNPEWIITGADLGKTEQVRARLLENPSIAATSAARSGHIVVLEYRVFLPLSPQTSHLVTALAEGVYGKRIE
jgi:iron complex transport system substrate-binding protein